MTAVAPSTVDPPAKDALFPEPLIDRKMLEDWRQASRVRAISSAYEDLLEQASDEGISIDLCMKQKGFSDEAAFKLSCPKFNLTCWPSELAELGSGVVLYFHFLAFLGCFLFLAFIVQLPAVIEYMDKDRLQYWKLLSDDNDARDATMMDDLFYFASPGHLGPKGGDKAEIPFCYFVLVCCLAGAIVAKSAWQVWVDAACDDEVTHPNDFAIMVEGLPRTATNEADIMDFFKQHAVRGVNDTEVVKVVIGWTADEYRRLLRARNALIEQIRDLDPVAQAAEKKEKEQEFIKINTELQAVADGTGGSRLHSSGVVVVSFRYQADMRRCLARWTGIWAALFYRDWGACCGMCPGPSLPKLPIGTAGVGVWKLKVQRAPNPGDINWDDLGVSWQERWLKLTETNLCMLGVIVLAFGMTFAMATLKENAEGGWLGSLPAIGIVIANVATALLAAYFGKKEFHNTRTGEIASTSLKMTLGMIVNTGGVILLVNRKDWQWYVKAGLVSDVFWLMGLTNVMQPLFSGLVMYFFRYTLCTSRSMNSLTDERIKTLREGADFYNKNGVTEATKDAFASFKKDYVDTLNYYKQKVFMPMEMDFKRRYAWAVRNFVCCMLFCPLAPFVSLLGIAGLAVQYWVDKFMLTSRYKYPTYTIGKDQAGMSLTFVRLCILFVPACMFFFLEPSWSDSDDLWTYFYLSYAPALGICILPLSTIRWILCSPCRGRGSARIASTDSKEDYYQAQYLWPRDQKYHKSHGLYMRIPEAKNPEFLDPNVVSTTKADDVVGSYGAFTAATAKPTPTTTVTVTPAVTPTFGATATDPSATTTVTVTPAVTPTMAPTDPSTVTPAVTPTIAPTDAPIVTPAVTPIIAPTGGGDTDGKGSGKGSGKSSGKGSGGAVWERQCKHGFQPFEDMCQDHIEKQYQKWIAKGKKSGDDARINVKTDDRGTKVSIDFEKETSMLIKKKGGGHVTKIRRR